jgi:ligand-binding SRPBCC domain-containing protein
MPITVDKAWEFFSRPDNLKHITPADMGFDITSAYHGEKMYPGQVIEYRLQVMGFVKMYWMTEITHVQEKQFFVDEQRFGPYALWHHQHHFAPLEGGGVEMTDLVHYKIPWGVLGTLSHALYVKKQLKHIFDYRFEKVESLFGKYV